LPATTPPFLDDVDLDDFDESLRAAVSAIALVHRQRDGEVLNRETCGVEDGDVVRLGSPVLFAEQDAT
jgi:hypothetical protein